MRLQIDTIAQNHESSESIMKALDGLQFRPKLLNP
jgi:hypothetical protein